MPKSRSKPLAEEQDRTGPPPGQAEVERAIGRILDHLKPKAAKPGRKASRVAAG